jgi:hypothetical protein
MDAVKKLIAELPPDELRANVRTCVEHTCAAFLGCNPEGRLARGGTYNALSEKQAEYVKWQINIQESDDMGANDSEYEQMFEVFSNKIASTDKFWKSFNHPIHLRKADLPKEDHIISVLLGTIQAIELSPVPTALPHLFEALVRGEWKAFLMIFVDLITPSRTILEVLGIFVMYSMYPSSELSLLRILEWCKKELSPDDGPVDKLIQSLCQPDREAT